MYWINVNHDSCHRINLSLRGDAYLINEITTVETEDLFSCQVHKRRVGSLIKIKRLLHENVFETLWAFDGVFGLAHLFHFFN